MNELEELQSIMKLLKKYELPISPILEYAIEERISQISSIEETKLPPSSDLVQENATFIKADEMQRLVQKRSL